MLTSTPKLFMLPQLSMHGDAGPSSPVASPGYSAMPANEPSPFGPPTAFSSQPPTWASPDPQTPVPGPHQGVQPPPYHYPSFTGYGAVPTPPHYTQTPSGAPSPRGNLPRAAQHYGPTGLPVPSMPLTAPHAQSASTAVTLGSFPMSAPRQQVYPTVFTPSLGPHPGARAPPSEDAFAAIVSAEMRGAPRAKAGTVSVGPPLSQGGRTPTVSVGSEGDEATQARVMHGVGASTDATGPMGGQAALSGTSHQLQEVVSAGVRGAPAIAADTLPGPGGPLPPLPAAPVAFEGTLAGGQAVSGEKPAGAPEQLTGDGAKVAGGPDASGGTSDWDMFVADR
jgi:hypothetical protein